MISDAISKLYVNIFSENLFSKTVCLIFWIKQKMRVQIIVLSF